MGSSFKTTLLLAAGAAAGAGGTYAAIVARAPAGPASGTPTLEATREADAERVDREPIDPRATRTLTATRDELALDPRDALQAALELRNAGDRSAALARIGAQWVRTDPLAALEAADAVPVEARDLYLSRVSRAWADIDPTAFLAYAGGAARLDELTAGLQLLVASDPAAVLELALRSAAPRRSPLAGVWALAARAMVERAPLETLRRLEALPIDTRGELLRAAGDAYARIDAESAIAWMRSLDPRSPSAERGVIAAIAATNFDRALALEQSLPQTSFAQALVGRPAAAVDGATRDPRNAAAVATALMRRDEQRAPQHLANVLSTWITRNTDAALDFIIANQDELDAALATSVAAKLAATDLDRAITSIDRIPSTWRDAWVMRTAAAYAEEDIEAAVSWIGGYRELAAYEEIFARVIIGGAASNPAFAARHVEMLPPARRREAVANVVGPWLREDSTAATQWATSLSDPALAADAIGSLIFQWVQFEPQAAERWTLDAPKGPLRDAALRMLMRSSATGKYDPTRFLGEFSSAERRRDAVRWAARMLSMDAERSEKLLRAALDDPALADWAREQLAALTASR